MKHAIQCLQCLERAMVHRSVTRAGGDANAYRTFAVELAMRASANLPETFHAAGHDVVVGAAQSSIGAEAQE